MIDAKQKKGWDDFLTLCLSAESNQRLDRLLKLFFTPEEQSQISTRLLLVRALLAKKKTQREISKDLSVSIAKITRGSNGLKMIDDDLKAFLVEALSED